MGFYAKAVVLCETRVKADQVGKEGETECILWRDSGLDVDFGRVTRLEKLTGDRFKHLEWEPFQRAAIGVVDCLISGLFERFDERFPEPVAPELLIPKPMFRDEDAATQTVKEGGRIYVDCRSHRLEGRLKDGDTVTINHNNAIGMDLDAFRRHTERHHMFMDGPMTWSSCEDIARWLAEAETVWSEMWQAISKDPMALAFVVGWRHQFNELGKVGARALVRFS